MARSHFGLLTQSEPQSAGVADDPEELATFPVKRVGKHVRARLSREGVLHYEEPPTVSSGEALCTVDSWCSASPGARYVGTLGMDAANATRRRKADSLNPTSRTQAASAVHCLVWHRHSASAAILGPHVDLGEEVHGSAGRDRGTTS